MMRVCRGGHIGQKNIKVEEIEVMCWITLVPFFIKGIFSAVLYHRDVWVKLDQDISYSLGAFSCDKKRLASAWSLSANQYNSTDHRILRSFSYCSSFSVSPAVFLPPSPSTPLLCFLLLSLFFFLKTRWELVWEKKNKEKKFCDCSTKRRWMR